MSDRRAGVLWPMVLVGLGLLLLLQALGRMPAGWWPALVELWPVLVIVAGLDMLFGRRSAAAVALVVGLGVVLVAGTLTWSAIRASQVPAGPPQDLIQTTRGAARLRVVIDFQAGELELGALGASDYVMEGSAQNAPGETLRQAYTVAGAEGALVLEQKVNPLLAPFLAGQAAPAQWRLSLTPRLPLALEIATGASAATLDLSGLRLTELALNTGAGTTQLTFPPAGPIRARVTGGAGTTSLIIPVGLPARIQVRSGSARVDLPTRFGGEGGTYTTPGFDPSTPFLELEIAAGTGQVKIDD